MDRRKTLEAAIHCVCESREAEYGTPENSFLMIARLWSTYLDKSISEHDVAMMMALLKVARIKTGRGSEDSYVDLAGYAACAAEIKGVVDRLMTTDYRSCENCKHELVAEDDPPCQDCVSNNGKIDRWELRDDGM